MSTEPTAGAPVFPDLRGRAALVTGSAAGIGRATAEALLAQGATVAGIDVDAADLGPGYRHLACDLRDPAAIDAAVTALPALDHVVNVAGIDPLIPLANGDAAAWDRVIDLDLRAYYLVIRAAAPLLKRGHGRSIVNVSSINYRLGVPRRSIYSAAKAGILGLTRGLARELGADGIRINTVSPGWVFTARQEAEYFHGPDAAKHLEYLHRVQSLTHHVSPADVASHILFYLSDASRASTGHNCVVDAGWLLE